MTQLFANKAGQQLLESLREIFEHKHVYHRKYRFILFVCGGPLSGAETSLRKMFLEWADRNLPDFVCLLAEEALRDSFAGEGRRFVNLATFESIVADVADCVLIFPESAGSWAETGFFSNSTIRNKTLVVNPLSLQAIESFLNLGPIDRISADSFLRPTVLVNIEGSVDFAPVALRLKERVKWPEHRERLYYGSFGQFTFRQKLLVVFGVLRLLRLADMKTLRHALKACFGGNPRYQEIGHLLRILLAAKFVRREGGFFRTLPGVELLEIEHVEVERLLAQVGFFYQKNSQELFDALPEPSR